MAIKQLLKLKLMTLPGGRILRKDTCGPPSELLGIWYFGVLCFTFCILSFLVFHVLYFAFEFFEEGYLRASFRAAETPSQVPNLRIFKYSKAHSPDDLFVFKYVSRKIRKLEKKVVRKHC